MSNENFEADPEALARAGKRITALDARLQDVLDLMEEAAAQETNPQGQDDYGRLLQSKFTPMLTSAQKFTTALSKAVEGLGDATANAAVTFDEADSDASSHARRH